MSGARAREAAFRIGYALFAVLLLALGLRFLLGPWGLLPELTAAATARAGGNPDFLHALHELGSVLVALGLGSAWCAVRLSASRPIHLVLAAAFIAIALVHWFDVRDVPAGIAARLGWGTPAALLVFSYLVHPAKDSA